MIGYLVNYTAEWYDMDAYHLLRLLEGAGRLSLRMAFFHQAFLVHHVPDLLHDLTSRRVCKQPSAMIQVCRWQVSNSPDAKLPVLFPYPAPPVDPLPCSVAPE